MLGKRKEKAERGHDAFDKGCCENQFSRLSDSVYQVMQMRAGFERERCTSRVGIIFLYVSRAGRRGLAQHESSKYCETVVGPYRVIITI